MAWLTGLRSMPILKRRVTTVPEQALHDAVTELRAAILALTELIQREYPNREEVEKRFTKKKTSQRRWFLVLALIPKVATSTPEPVESSLATTRPWMPTTF
jgi:hypothetical protein